MEKIIREFKVIETEDGFRIEIKGDKEKMKSFKRYMKGDKRRSHRRRWRKGGHFGFGPMMWCMKMASEFDPWGFDEDFEEEPEESEDTEA